ncbi:MAG: hypothetical protein JWO30_2847 [Fibrobacteres bacterium]|nr:hypothetical protein [Fibrobacterota bacterium]
MPFKNSQVASRWNKGLFFLGLVSILSLSAMHCNSGESDSDQAAVQIIAPVAGAKFKITDTNYIIIQTDTARFLRRAYYVAFSTDSGACWAPDCGKGNSLTPIVLKGNKGAIRRDTVKWVPGDDFFIKVGQSVKVRVVDYPPSTITLYSGFFTITD